MKPLLDSSGKPVVRPPKKGEWYMFGGEPTYATMSDDSYNDQPMQILTPSTSAEKAIQPVIREAKEREGSVIDQTQRGTWNPEAHVELTLTAQEIWDLQDAVSAQPDQRFEDIAWLRKHIFKGMTPESRKKAADAAKLSEFDLFRRLVGIGKGSYAESVIWRLGASGCAEALKSEADT